MPPRLSTSRAYWNLRAEQVMDRVFSDGEQRLEAVTVQVEPASAPAAPRATAAAPERQPRTLRWMLALIGMPALISMAMSVWLARNWQASQRALSRERDLQLIERVRRLPWSRWARRRWAGIRRAVSVRSRTRRRFDRRRRSRLPLRIDHPAGSETRRWVSRTDAVEQPR